MELKDSGNRTEFETGAVRDIHEGKGRFDLMPLDIIAELWGYPFKEIEPDYENTNKFDTVFMAIHKFKDTGNIEYLYLSAYNFLCDSLFDGNVEYNNTYFYLLELAKHYENGALKYGEYNWQKGIPVHSCIDSALRHYTKYKCGFEDEPHDVAFLWNIITAIYMVKYKPKMNDFCIGDKINKM